MTKPHFQQAIHERNACSGLKKAAEGNICHVCQLRHFGQRYLFLKILVHIIDRLPDPAAAVGEFDIVERRIR